MLALFHADASALEDVSKLCGLGYSGVLGISKDMYHDIHW